LAELVGDQCSLVINDPTFMLIHEKDNPCDYPASMESGVRKDLFLKELYSCTWIIYGHFPPAVIGYCYVSNNRSFLSYVTQFYWSCLSIEEIWAILCEALSEILIGLDH
jgi:hypothetical protein